MRPRRSNWDNSIPVFKDRNIPMPTDIKERAREKGAGRISSFFERFARRKLQDSEGMFEGRRVIRRDSKINGGVYLGKGKREALVVDWDKMPTLNGMYNKVFGKHSTQKAGAISTVFDAISNQITVRDPGELDHFSNNMNRFGRNDTRVSLDVFFQNQIGVCRHMALGSAVMVERLIKDGVLDGKVSVDRNRSEMHEGKLSGGHAWCRYTSNSTGKVYIIDPMLQDRVVDLDSIANESAANGSIPENTWDYFRPEDKEKYGFTF